MGQEVVGYGAAVDDGTGDALHVAFAKLDAGARAFTIIDKDLTVPPGSPAIGDTYIVGASATGDWSTHDGKIAVFGLGSTWLFVAPVEGMLAYAQDEDAEYRYDGSAWGVAAGSGLIAQVVNTQTGAVATTTTAIPADDTIPQNTEGAEFMSLAITPTNASSTLIIEVVVYGAPSATVRWCIAALFQDSAADAIAVGAFGPQDAHGGVNISFKHKMTAGTTSAITFKVRAGINSTGTFTFNGNNSARLFGGVFASSITITEVLP